MAKNRPRFFEIERAGHTVRQEILGRCLEQVEEKKIDDLIEKMRSDMLRHGKKRITGSTSRVTRGDQATSQSGFTEAQGGRKTRAKRTKKTVTSVSSRVQGGRKKGATKSHGCKTKARTGNSAGKATRSRNLSAELLGVSEQTLRRWDKAGKLRAARHPMNGYRLYTRDVIVKLRRRILTGTGTAG